MKKSFKVILPIASIFTIIICFCGIVILNGSAPKGKANEDNSSWMKYIDNETYINNIALPGSHDAGTSGMVWLGETQNLTIKDQLKIGVRYFDIRVNKKSEDNYVIYHSVINGSSFKPIIEDIKNFITANPTETLLLDFQHFENDSQSGVLSFIDDYLLDNDLLIRNTTDKQDLEFISSLKLKDTRGKCIVFWGDRTMASSYDYLFARNNDTCEKSDMCLDSYYEESFHKDYSASSFIEKAIPYYFNDIKRKIDQESYKGIFVLQCQLTDGKLIFGPYSREKKASKDFNNYIKTSLPKEDENIKLVNVIMRDFVSVEKSKCIFVLNYYKGNIKESMLSEFTQQYIAIS
ncbi:MAG: phosphatidylinositol-specific phospholipase C domain-containing protein [Bacilli bacterium]|nr:phosphatidylinositol-specific phospholipase C domain-containing protein [Bacilli bacterium]